MDLRTTNFTEFQNANELYEPLHKIDTQLYIYKKDGKKYYSYEPISDMEQLAYTPAIPPERLGDSTFCKEHDIKYPYIGGSMAYGISSAEMVTELGKNGMTGFIGTGGLGAERTEKAIKQVRQNAPEVPFGCNLIYVPSGEEYEKTLVSLYLKEHVEMIEASAFVDMTPQLVRYRAKGLRRDENGKIIERNRIIAKASRVEVAAKFLSPASEKLISSLLDSGEITQEEAELLREVPIASDITAEADSGGHTDCRPAMPLFSSFCAVRDRLQPRYDKRIRVGLGGGIGTPYAAAAAFAMGAAYIVVGSIHQACVESGTSDIVREMLAKTGQADTAIAPSADMFDIGGKVQVIKTGTLFAMRAQKLLALYNSYNSLEEIPQKDREFVEKNILRDSFENVWHQTVQFFKTRSIKQLEKAEKSPKYKMALVFRYYLGKASGWAIAGDLSRKIDFQIWSGPAIGAFNEWTKDSFLENIDERRCATVAKNILFGASVIARMDAIRHCGVDLFTDIPIRPRKY